MQQFAHGGDIRTYGEVLDFSANLNPLGMPPKVSAAAKAAVDFSIHYPDPFCREVRQKIAERDGVSVEQIVCGNGAADLIFRLCATIKPQKAVITAPTFAEYEQALEQECCEIRLYQLCAEDGFALDERFLEALNPDTDIVFLCTPNNPTGQLIDDGLFRKIAEKCGENEIILVLDECFLELSDNTSGYSQLAKENKRLILLRAFTKSFGIPGLRFGYAICYDAELLEKLERASQPWSVSNVAQAAAAAACDCTSWADEGRALVQKERPILVKNMRELGLEVWEGQANYLLFRARGISDLREKMVKQGVLIRSCANYHGLSNDYYRIAVRDAHDNAICVNALREVLQNG